MTDPTYRAAARMHFEPAPRFQAHRLPMAHRIPMAHRTEPQPASLGLSVIVLAAGLIEILLVIALWPR